jgi:hypothetical protein
MPEIIDAWPALSLEAWQDTYDTLHMWTQIVGKIRKTLTPLVNHWWNVTLYVTSRGLTTSPIPYGTRTFEISFDFIDHKLDILTSEGPAKQIDLAPKPVAQFYQELMDSLNALGIDVTIHATPDEVANPIPFAEDFTQILRSGVRPQILAHPGYNRLRVQRVSRPLHRQVQPSAFFLGQL